MSPLISIDDRDVNNYFTTEIDHRRYKDLLQAIQSDNAGSIIIHMGGGVYKIESPCIDCTGSDVLLRIKIPFMHILQKCILLHTDSNKNSSHDDLSYTLVYRNNYNLEATLISITDSTGSCIQDEYTGHLYNNGQYLLTSNTTNNDKIFVETFLRYIGG